jgi:hypothetical protein
MEAKTSQLKEGETMGTMEFQIKMLRWMDEANKKAEEDGKIILEALAKTATNKVVNNIVHEAITKAKEEMKEEYKRHNSTWFKEKSNLIKSRLAEAREKMMKYMEESVAQTVATKAEADLKDAKDKITKHAAEATMREEEHRRCMQETRELLEHMREHETTYRTDSREYENQRAIIKQQRQKLEKMEVEMTNLQADMARFRNEAKEALDVYDDMKGLRADVTKQSDWMDDTAKKLEKEILPKAQAAEVNCNKALNEVNRQTTVVMKMQQQSKELDEKMKDFDSRMVMAQTLIKDFEALKPLLEQATHVTQKIGAIEDEIKTITTIQQELLNRGERLPPIVSDEKLIFSDQEANL